MNTPLRERIFQAIAASEGGSLSFADYMALCLYAPGQGYYASPSRRPLGRGGDFYTSVSVGAGFGYFLGLALESRWRERHGAPPDFAVVEQGGHDGQLALDILAGLRERGSPLAQAIRYHVLEPDSSRAAELEERLAREPGAEAIQVVADAPARPGPAGLFLCNELLDAFPVHRLRREQGRWRELRVGASGSGADRAFRWVSADLEPGSGLSAEAGKIPSLNLFDGYVTEVCLEIQPWMKAAAAWFHSGTWWVIDYGMEETDYHGPERREGTLRCYREHRVTSDPFEAPGETDLTCDVDFTRLDRAAAEQGLRKAGFTDQHHFLIREAAAWLQELERGGPSALAPQARRLRQFQTLTHPGLMGRAFKVAEYAR